LVARFGKLRYNDNMKLTEHSRNRLLETFKVWEVPKDFAEPMFNYLVYGYQPGSCFTAVLANDFINAIRSSHPANTVEAFKALAGWISETLPPKAYGSYAKVDAWCDITWDGRRPILEKHGLVYTKEQEMMLVLSGEKTIEPILW